MRYVQESELKAGQCKAIWLIPYLDIRVFLFSTPCGTLKYSSAQIEDTERNEPRSSACVTAVIEYIDI